MLGIVTIIFAILSLVFLILIFASDEKSTLKTVGVWGAGICTLFTIGLGLFWYKYKDQESTESQPILNESSGNTDSDQ
jgi:hypothetical protein